MTLMKNAKRSLEMQDDPMAEQTLLTVNLLISWSHLLLDPSQDALGIILQKSKYGKVYSPIEKYFEYLDELDERISVAMRHRATQNAGRPKETKSQKGQGAYEGNQSTTLRGTHDSKPEAGDRRNKTGCGVFCKTGQFHPRFLCPNIANGKVTEESLKERDFCSCCLQPKEKCQQGHANRRDGTQMTVACDHCHKHLKLPVHQACPPRTQGAGPGQGASGSDSYESTATELQPREP